MNKSTPKKQRLEMNVTLYCGSQKVATTKRYIKTRLRAFLTGIASDKWTHGKLTVWYSRPNDYWNAGEFSTQAEFETLLGQFTEWDLVKDFIRA